jgi:hypothetical protein
MARRILVTADCHTVQLRFELVVGNFYTNLTVRGPDQATVTTAAENLRLRAFVSPTYTGLTVICEKESDTQDSEIWHRVAKTVSQKLNCSALAVLNHDDDILMYALYSSGKLADEYNSYPSYWDETDEPPKPTGGDTQILCDLFGMPGDTAEVARVLRNGNEDHEEFLFAMDRHAALLKALAWPVVPFQQGFDYLTQDGLPTG